MCLTTITSTKFPPENEYKGWKVVVKKTYHDVGTLARHEYEPPLLRGGCLAAYAPIGEWLEAPNKYKITTTDRSYSLANMYTVGFHYFAEKKDAMKYLVSMRTCLNRHKYVVVRVTVKELVAFGTEVHPVLGTMSVGVGRFLRIDKEEKEG